MLVAHAPLAPPALREPQRVLVVAPAHAARRHHRNPALPLRRLPLQLPDLPRPPRVEPPGVPGERVLLIRVRTLSLHRRHAFTLRALRASSIFRRLDPAASDFLMAFLLMYGRRDSNPQSRMARGLQPRADCRICNSRRAPRTTPRGWPTSADHHQPPYRAVGAPSNARSGPSTTPANYRTEHPGQACPPALPHRCAGEFPNARGTSSHWSTPPPGTRRYPGGPNTMPLTCGAG